jgi:hypothetical protein
MTSSGYGDPGHNNFRTAHPPQIICIAQRRAFSEQQKD